MKIVFLDRKTLGNDVSLEQFDKLGEIIVYETTSAEQTLNRVQDADVVVTNKVVIDKEIMDNSSIKLICIAATGMNNIDLEYAKQKGIEVKNVVGYSTSSVVQLTLSLVLQFVQKVDKYDKYGKFDWKYSDIFTNLSYPFYELDNKKWGIIGLGNIGLGVAKVVDAFGCEVQYFSTSGKNKNDQYAQVSLEELLKTSDIISIHSALNDQTLNLLNKENIKTIKKGAILVNLGRGGIVNELDISDAICNGQDIYYGTDVVTKEPIESTNPLLTIKDKDRIIITPHIAWGSKEARIRLIDAIEKNIVAESSIKF
jgi:glycerate dehydrogenase